MVKFLRRDWNKYSKLGKRRKKKQRWKKPTGRDNKMREKVKGHPVVVSIGYSTDKSVRGKIKKKKPIIVNNLKDLENIKQDEIAIIGSIGKKKKIKIAKKAKDKNIEIHNMNPKKFLNSLRVPSKKTKLNKESTNKDEPKK